MIVRLVLEALALFAAVGVLGVSSRKLLSATLEKRRQQRLGAARLEMMCPGCSEQVNPSDVESLFNRGKWWHAECLRKLIA